MLCCDGDARGLRWDSDGDHKTIAEGLALSRAFSWSSIRRGHEAPSSSIEEQIRRIVERALCAEKSLARWMATPFLKQAGSVQKHTSKSQLVSPSICTALINVVDRFFSRLALAASPAISAPPQQALFKSSGSSDNCGSSRPTGITS